MPEPGMKPAPLRLLSVVMPARNEEAAIGPCLRDLSRVLARGAVPHEILVVDDGSTDGTCRVVGKLGREIPGLQLVRNAGPHGFGRAIVLGLDRMSGDAAAVVMADDSDDPDDLVAYWKKLNEGYDCVFGSRFLRGSRLSGYPWPKRILNRTANLLIALLFGLRFNDTTNAFKAYRRTCLDGLRPFLSPHFNLTVELPLKAVVRGYRWASLPIAWRNRREGSPKFRIAEMGSRYLFIIFYCWLEKYFSRGDYHRTRQPAASPRARRSVGASQEVGV